MNTILRNLFYTLGHFRLASFLNLLGLSAAFAAFVIIMMKVGYGRSFDTCYPDADRVAILNVRVNGDPSYLGGMLPRGMLDFVIEQTPGVECGSIYAGAYQKVPFYTDPENPSYFLEQPYAVYKDFVRTVGLTFIEGNAEGMDEPDGMLLPETLARKFFPEGNAVGSYVYRGGDCWIMDENVTRFRVCGVYRDFPENSQFADNPPLVRMNDLQKGDWGPFNFFAFVRLKPGVTPQDIDMQMERAGVNRRMSENWGDRCEAYVTPLPEVYYTFGGGPFVKTGNRQSLYLLVSIALLIIVVAGINLINFSTALTPMRIRSINTQKVLGSSVGALRSGLIGESVCIAFLAWLVSLLLVLGLEQANGLAFLGFTPSLLSYWKPVAASALVAVTVGALAGLYPAFYMTSFPPAMMLKGNYALSGRGKRLRTFLIGFQYVVSFVLIILTAFIYRQNEYMRQYELGVDRDRLLVAYLPNLPVTNSMYQGFDQQVKGYPEVAGVAYASMELGGMNLYSTYPLSYRDVERDCFLITVSPDFCSTMGLEVVEGRSFLPNDSVWGGHLNLVATQNVKTELGIPAGEYFDFHPWREKAQIVGYVNNVQLTSLQMGRNSPFVFVTNPTFKTLQMPYAYIRIKAGSDIDDALSHIRRALEDNFTGYSIDVRFFDQVYASLYQKETDQQYMVTLFSILAVLISLVGVFGLVIFEAEYRRKEIGIRKVYGATTEEILWMFGRFYLFLVIVCFAIAAPVAWYLADEWLKDFSVRISLSGGVFAAAFLLIALITLVTITVQNYRTASANPVDSIKSE